MSTAPSCSTSVSQVHSSGSFPAAFETAQREFESAIALDPRLYETWYFYARVCFEKGQLAEAARFFEQAAALSDQFAALLKEGDGALDRADLSEAFGPLVVGFR